MSLSQGKIKYFKALSNEKGVIAAAAMDQRGSLQKSIAAAKGVSQNDVTYEIMSEFKVAVAKVLTPHASAILLDPEFGLEAAKARDSQCGLLLAYEKSGYDNTQPGRLPDLLLDVSVKRIKDMGGDAVKILLYYTPNDKPEINEIKHAFIERVGAECAYHDIPFFLEFIAYDATGEHAEKSLGYAKMKPELVLGSMKEFSKPQYLVDVLKVEVPINAIYTEGSKAFKGEKAYTMSEAMDHFKRAADVATKPFIYLSAGVDNDVFVEQLTMATNSGVDYSGILCGRATWKDGIAVYGKQGVNALEDWLSTEGVKNINAVNAAIGGAKPWYAKLGLSGV